MNYKKGLLALCLIMCILFTVSSVAAGDVNETAIASDDTIANEETLTTEEISDDKIAINENDIITKANETNDADSVLTVKNDETPSSVVEGENIKITVYKQTGNYARFFKEALLEVIQQNQIDYLHYQNVNNEDQIIVNTSVKDALNDFCQLHVTCKGLAGYMGHKYKNISYKEHTIKGFRLTYDEFRDFLDVSG